MLHLLNSVLLLSMAVFLLYPVNGQSLDVPNKLGDSVSVNNEDLAEQQPNEDEEPYTDRSENVDFMLALRSRIIYRNQPPSGYSNGYYSGSAEKLYERVLCSIGKNISCGIILEKDPGEKLTSGFSTMNFAFRDVCPIVKNIVLGDFRIESGQGLILWSGRGFTKGAEVITPVRRKPRGVITTLSPDEFYFLRGIGAETVWQSLSAIFFLSAQRRSASLDSNNAILSLNRTGFYRTKTELEQHNNTSECLYGGRITYGFRFIRGFLGLTLLAKKYSRDFSSGLQMRYMKVASFDISAILNDLSFFGEIACAKEYSAGIAGVFLNPHRNCKIVATYRLYPVGYMALHTVPFGERGYGESGFYMGINIQPWEFVDISCYFDQYEKIEANDFNSEGDDYLVNLKFLFLKRLNLAIQYRDKSFDFVSYRSRPESPAQRYTCMNRKQKFRLTAECKVSSYISVVARFEKNYFYNGNNASIEHGYLFYHDISIKSLRYWIFSVRVSYFSSSSYKTVPYELERDLEGVFTQSLLSGEGIRFYLLVGYEISGWLKISGKYSLLQRDDVLKIGNGQDRLPSNKDSRISIQADIHFQ